MDENNDLSEILKPRLNIYTRPVRHYIEYKKEVQTRRDYYKHNLLFYYPVYFYKDYIKPEIKDTFWSSFKYCCLINIIMIVLNRNPSFGRLIERMENLIAKAFFRVFRIKNA